MNITKLRLHYTRLLLVCLLVISLFVMSLSLPGGISQFEKNFWGRQFLISSFARLRLTLRDRVFSQALVGRDGWLEYTGDSNLDDYQSVNATSPEALKNTQQKIYRLYKELRKRNITLLIVIAPNKATIYPDKLPDEIQKLGPKSNLDAFAAYLKKNGPPVLLDLRPALQNARNIQDVYYSTDTHWNAYGAFIAYTEIMKELSKTYPQLTSKNINNFKIKTYHPYLHDIPKIIGATNVRETGLAFIPQKNNVVWAINLNKDNIIPMQVSTTSDKSAPVLLMYMDSFGYGMKNFLPIHFRKATYIQNNSRYPELMALKKIDEIKPDIVIIEFVERSLHNKKLDDLLQQLLQQKTK